MNEYVDVISGDGGFWWLRGSYWRICVMKLRTCDRGIVPGIGLLFEAGHHVYLFENGNWILIEFLKRPSQDLN